LALGKGEGKGIVMASRVSEIRYGGALSEFEKIVAISKIVEYSGSGTAGVLPLLRHIGGEKMTEGRAERLLALLELNDETLESLHSGKLTTGDLFALQGHGAIDTAEAAAILCSEPMTRGTRKEALRLILYLGDQGAPKWKGFLEEAGPAGLPLVERLYSSCYPYLTRDLETFSRIVEEIGLPSGAVITPPSNFEGGSYDLKIRILDEGSFSMIIEKLKDSLEGGKIAKLLDILAGRR
jgi:hypothetical protein